MALIFYTSVAKGLKLKVRKFFIKKIDIKFLYLQLDCVIDKGLKTLFLIAFVFYKPRVYSRFDLSMLLL